MRIVTATEMREIDRATTQKYGVPSLTLMENAGEAVANFILQPFSAIRLSTSKRGRITVVCGKGNNGGDGFVAARKLQEHGKDVSVIVLADRNDVKGNAKTMLARLPLRAVSVTSTTELEAHQGLFKEADVIVDAIFGTGFRPPLPDLARAAIELMGESRATIVSVDLPSGVDADWFGLEHSNACRSDAIVSFTALKAALVFGMLTRGPIGIHSIGSPDEAIVSTLGLEWNSPPEILERKRPLNSNKGLFGHALIVGGSLGKSGAPTMASMAALRVGAGLVTCAVPRSTLGVVAGAIPELMTAPLDENTAGAVSEGALAPSAVKALLERKNVVALGPGLGRDPESVRAVRDFVARGSLPLILDADGLNAFAGESHLLSGNGRPLILTPHPGEMARLVGTRVAEIEKNRVEVARKFAREHALILVLKGWRTLIADPEGNIWVNTNGNPGLAKGGSGDVLTGMIAGLVAQFPDRIVDAVRGAVYLHGLAADLALRSQTENTMLANDVIARFAAASRQLQRPGSGFTWIQRGFDRR